MKQIATPSKYMETTKVVENFFCFDPSKTNLNQRVVSVKKLMGGKIFSQTKCYVIEQTCCFRIILCPIMKFQYYRNRKEKWKA